MAAGLATVSLTNPHGATITPHAVQNGMKLTLAAGGVNIERKSSQHLKGRSVRFHKELYVIYGDFTIWLVEAA